MAADPKTRDDAASAASPTASIDAPPRSGGDRPHTVRRRSDAALGIIIGVVVAGLLWLMVLGVVALLH